MFDGKIIECSLCGNYQVTSTAIGMLAARMRDQRFEILERAQREAVGGELPRISSSLF
jgi:hypothetical protein